MSLVYVVGVCEGKYGGIGICYNITKTTQLGVNSEEASQQIVSGIGILYSLKIPVLTGSLNIISNLENCDGFRPSGTDSHPKSASKNNTFQEIAIMCKSKAQTMEKERRRVEISFHRKKKIPNGLATAHREARAALDKIRSLSLSNGLNKPLEILCNGQIRIYSLAGIYAPTITPSNKPAAVPLTVGGVKKINTPASIVPHSSSQISSPCDNKNKTDLAKKSEKNVQLTSNRANRITQANALFALCSRCTAVVCISCPDAHPLMERASSKLKSHYVMALTTCRQCIHTMIMSSVSKPSVTDVISYLGDSFNHISLSASFIESSNAFQYAKALSPTPCTVSNVNGMVTYIDIDELSRECDFTCSACSLDTTTGELIPCLRMNFL